MDMGEFLKNRSSFSQAELEKYAGNYVAWSPDGTKIVAADSDPIRLVARVQASGYHPQDCVISSVPLPEEVILGGSPWKTNQ